MIAFIMYIIHLDREVHTAGAGLHVVQDGIGSNPQTLGNKGKASSRVQKT